MGSVKLSDWRTGNILTETNVVFGSCDVSRVESDQYGKHELK